MCVLDREGSWVFTSRALRVVLMAICLTGYTDCLTSFHEPLLPTCRCHMGLENVWCHHRRFRKGYTLITTVWFSASERGGEAPRGPVGHGARGEGNAVCRTGDSLPAPGEVHCLRR